MAYLKEIWVQRVSFLLKNIASSSLFEDLKKEESSNGLKKLEEEPSKVEIVQKEDFIEINPEEELSEAINGM